ncbi:MAG: hypothetical protein QW059_01720 [Nitrososphaerota archaeon]
MKKMSIHIYQCPNCGAPYKVREGDVAIKCSYCNTVFRTFEDEKRFIIPVYYDSSRAIENFLLWVKKQTGYEESLPFNINLLEVKLHFYPFWVVSLNARTTFTGVGEYAEFSNPDSGGYRNIRVMTREESGSFERFFELVLPASKDIPSEGEVVGVSRMRKFFSHEYVEQQGGVLHGATITREDAKSMAEQIAAAELSRLIMREVVTVNTRNDQIQIKEIALVYIPLWHVSYEFRGEKYRAFIDASSSRIIYASYPPDIAEKTAYLGVAALHVVLGVVSAFLFWGFGWLPVVTVFIGFITAAVVYAWRGLSPTRAREMVDERDLLRKQVETAAKKWLR